MLGSRGCKLGWAALVPLGELAANGREKGTVCLVLQNLLRPSGHGMRVMSDVTNPLAREHTMTKVQGKSRLSNLKEHLSQGNCIWISLDRPNALGRLVSNRVLRNCVSLRPHQARRVEHSFHLRHQREALAAKNFKCNCPD